jgi:hypothetical protein
MHPLRARLDQALDAARAAQAAVSAAATSLVEDTRAHSTDALVAALDGRRDAFADVGAALIGWLAEGGALVEAAAAEAPDASPLGAATETATPMDVAPRPPTPAAVVGAVGAPPEPEALEAPATAATPPASTGAPVVGDPPTLGVPRVAQAVDEPDPPADVPAALRTPPPVALPLASATTSANLPRAAATGADRDPAAGSLPPRPSGASPLPPPRLGPGPATLRPTGLAPREAPSAASVQQLLGKYGGAAARDGGLDPLAPILEALGPPKRFRSAEECAGELTRLEAWLDQANRQWSTLDAALRRRILAHCVARARAVQDVGHADGERMQRLFSGLTAHSRRTRPGSVPALARDSKPESESWLADARRTWEELGGAAVSTGTVQKSDAATPERALKDLDRLLSRPPPDAEALKLTVIACLDAGVAASDPRLAARLAPWEALLHGPKRLGPVRKAIQESAASKVEDGEEDPDTSVVEDDWPGFAWTRDKVAILIGGDKRETTKDRLQRVFGFAEVEWDSGHQPRRNDAIARRIERGGVDMVVLLARFMSHKTWDALHPLCKRHGVPCVLVDKGYGIAQIRRAMEKTLSSGEFARAD